MRSSEICWIFVSLYTWMVSSFILKIQMSMSSTFDGSSSGYSSINYLSRSPSVTCSRIQSNILDISYSAKSEVSASIVRLSKADDSEGNAIIPWTCQLPPKVHQRIFRYCSSIDECIAKSLSNTA
jgi:hypothetical protein